VQGPQARVPTAPEDAAWVYSLARRNDEAVGILQRVIEIDPNFPRAHFRQGNIYEDEGKYHHAIDEYEKAVQLSNGDAYHQGSLGHAYAMSGMLAEAGKSLNHWKSSPQRGTFLRMQLL
jgi:tetratricopeptide (TPR) repeat protein